ncbi:hypothetical protein EDI_025660 [Entamoeba dispar SAW760]|uniref:Uncharacterized protein n=1 Tax=Entamoeba dispar (strain ATCC PRA-260 / SAW760) TaxID=370354 RepID=B0EBI8_ENTDS|nr:uncharacterized protein EDI_025660 [Entamoeba dispar SAW760]EDR28095.1 hypothetical protein EDI_025660 [Entamoeba dispar SAW760]|eukprot:EDR28095.1 hypothetical protein EDI_025660 [Entamoeba dispar SAW760]
MSDSESLSLSESDNFYHNRKLSTITAPSDVLKDVIDSDNEDINDISMHGTKDRTIAGNETEYQSRWRKREISPVRECRTYKERIKQHEKEMKEYNENKEKQEADKREKNLKTKKEHRERNKQYHQGIKKRERSDSRHRSYTDQYHTKH